MGRAHSADPRAGDDLLVVDSVPHDAVLPRAIVAMHHGGAGTVHATTRAGTPSILVPFLSDQPFWAAQLERIGLAGPPLHRNRLAPRRQRRDHGRDRRAGRVRQAAEQMGTERGTEAALKHILNTI